MGLTSSGGTFKGWYGYFNAATHGSEADLNIKTGYAGTSNIRFSADGDTTPAMLYIASAGNVGIGTTAPAVKFHVDGGKSLSRTTDSSWGQSAVANPNDAEVGFVWAAGGTGYPGVTSTYTRQWIAGLNPFGTGMDRWSLTNKTLGANTAITVLEGGNVGIGTTGPSAKLQVAGEIRASLGSTYGYVALQTGGATVQGYVEWFKPGPGRVGYMGYNDGSTANNLALTLESGANFVINNGNVGIGTASPIAKLSVYTTSPHSSPTGISVAAGAGGANLLARNTEYHNWFPYTDGNNYYSADNHIFRNASHTVDWVRITSGGNVGISTTSPANKLVVTSDASPTNENTYAIAAASASDPAYKTIIGYDYTNDIGLIAAVRTGIGWRNLSIPQGSLGIGTYSPGYKLEVNGTLGVNGNATFNGGNVYINSDNSYIGNNTTDLVSLSGGTMYLPGNGNVGIGTTAPGAKLDIVSTGSGSEGLRVDGSSGGFAFVVKGGSDYTSHIRAGATIGVNYFVTPPSNGLIVEGNVGIGTTSPSQKLHVVGNQYITGNITVGASGNYSNVNFVRNDGAGVGGIGWRSDGIFYVGGHLDYGPNAGNNVRVYGFGANLSLGNNTAGDVLTVTNGGNVGIGTTSPADKLEVVGNIRATTSGAYNSISVYNTGATGGGGFLAYQNGTPNAYFGAAGWYQGNSDTGVIIGTDSSSRPIRFFTNTERMRITGDGNVGIGTTSPGYKLDVVGEARFGSNYKAIIGNDGTYGAYSTIGFGGTSNGYNRVFGQDGTADGLYLASATGRGISFRVNGGTTDNMFINSSGNVGIGTTSPAYKLDVNGETRLGKLITTWSNSPISPSAVMYSESGYNTVFAGNGQFSTSYLALMTTGNMSYMGGNVGIGTTAPPIKFYVGTVLTGTVGNGTYASDAIAINSSESITIGPDRRADWGLDATTATSTTFQSKLNIWSDSEDHITFGGASTHLVSAWESFKIWINNDSADAGTFHLYHTSSKTEFARFTGSGNNWINGGNVGIGTTGPGWKLDVIGDVRASSYFVGGSSGQGFSWGNFTYGSYIDVDNSQNALRIRNTSGTIMLEVNGYLNYFTGKLGIGNNSPTYNLDVTGTGRFTSGLLSDSLNAVNYPYSLTLGTSGADAGSVTITAGSTSGYNTSIYVGGGGASVAPNNIVFNTASVERMRILSSGNVGIGTTSPSGKLSIVTSGTNDLLYLNSGVNTDFAYKIVSGSDDAFVLRRQHTTQGDLSIMSWTYSGKVGIGTTSPTGKLTISQNNSGGVAALTFTEDESTIQGPSANTKILMGGNLSLNAASTWVAGTNGSERMRITSAGNIGVNTTNPYAGTGVTSVTINASSYPILAFQNNGSRTGEVIGYYNHLALNTPGFIALSPGDSEAMRITTGGNVGIGTTSPVTGLDVRTSPYSNTTARFGTARPVYIINDDPIIGFNQYYNSGWKAGTTGYSGNVGVSSAGEMYFNVSTSSVVTDNIVTQREVMRILNNGNVGIGTTSPNYKLHVSGNAYINETLFVNQLTTIEDSLIVYDNLGVGTTTPSSKFHVVTGTTGNIAIFQGGAGRYIVTGTDGSGQYIEQVGNSSGERILRIQNSNGSGAYTQLFLDGGNQRIYTSTNVNVGIGTTSPGAKFQVSGGDGIINNAFIGEVPSYTSANAQFSHTSRAVAGEYSFLSANDGETFINSKTGYNIRFRVNNNDKVIINSAGNVGIGTTSPTFTLSVQGIAQARGGVYVTQAAPTNTLILNADDTGLHKIYTNSSVDLSLGANSSTTQLYLKNGGNVGIGITSPAEILHVKSPGNNGGVRYVVFLGQNSTGYQNSFVASVQDELTDLGAGIVGTNTGSNLSFSTHPNGGSLTERMRITKTGNVGIGTTTPSYNLHVEGNTSGISIYASHDIAAFSDITVKKEVKRIENAIEKVKELNGYTYVRTDDETGTRRAGVIAQEVQKVLPEVVSANPDGTLNVAYSNMIALLIEGMKEQQATIERMQQEINELKK
jgi:hypothetical protein